MIRHQQGGIMAGKDFEAFKHTIEEQFMRHPVVTSNAYTAWFARGEMSLDQLRRFAVEFSVFSNQFLLAALNRVINADTLQAARESKEILMNELGVIYNSRKHAPAAAIDSDREGDPALVATEGTVDGGKFRFQAAHFEWLLRFGQSLGLTFDDMGKRRHGSTTTLFFCDELFRLYGSDDYNEAMGAAFAVENWAAAGFWKELIAGLEKIKARQVPDMPLAFFTWHDKIEEQHKEHVWDELRGLYDSPKFREEPFLSAGVKMLDGVKVFWDGLNDTRSRTGKFAA
jgi:pyrroloquinoline quinone (PQQ) biosynthesis protein C